MKIKKIYQGELPENKILNSESNSQTDTYSCEYINNMSFVGGGENLDELPIGTRVEFNGDTIPDGWEQVEDYTFNIFTNGEQLIGQWADGGLLYRKVFVLSGSTGDVDIDITDLNTSTPFIDFSHSFIAYSGYRLPLNRYAGTTNWITAGIAYNSTSQKISIQFGDVFKQVSKTIVVVIEYTKKS
jgi:hypothetical protein